jgi:hypothetical protein
MPAAKDRDMLLITVWLEVRVLPGPPRTPTLTEISRELTNSPRLRGGVGPAYFSARKKGRFRGSSGPSVSGVQKPFPRSLRRSEQRLGSHATETGLRERGAIALSMATQVILHLSRETLVLMCQRSTGCQLGRPGFLGPLHIGELVRKAHALAVGKVEGGAQLCLLAFKILDGLAADTAAICGLPPRVLYFAQCYGGSRVEPPRSPPPSLAFVEPFSAYKCGAARAGAVQERQAARIWIYIHVSGRSWRIYSL